jgi:exopolysaccharide biosynthesis polyprenyl glycosylphosphotransferase
MTSTLGHSAGGLGPVDEAEVRQAEEAATVVAEAASQRAVATALEGGGHSARTWTRRYALLLLGADALAGLIATTVAYIVRPWVQLNLHARSEYLGDRLTYVQLAVASLVVWLTSLAASGAYRSKHFSRDERDYRIPVISALRLMSAVAILSYAFRADLSREMVLSYFAALIVAVVICRGLVNLVLRHARKRGRAHVWVLLVGEQRSVLEFADHLLARPDHNCDVVAVCATGTAKSLVVRGRSLPVVGTPDEVVESARAVGADAVLISNPAGLVNLTMQQLAWQLEQNHIDMLLAPDAVSLAGPRLKVSTLRGLPVTQVAHPQHESLLRTFHFITSRVIGALLALMVSPLLLAVALSVKYGSSGPVLYRQKRIGYKGREFEMLKFRSMSANAEEMLPELLALNEHDGALFKMANDPRVNRVGRLLRKYSLDELPQLLNVVRGDMALVGPRPCLAREMTMFGEAEHRRFMARPGMTGLWQVSGGTKLQWSDAVKTDLYYVDNWSPALDLVSLARTVKVVLAGNGC